MDYETTDKWATISAKVALYIERLRKPEKKRYALEYYQRHILKGESSKNIDTTLGIMAEQGIRMEIERIVENR